MILEIKELYVAQWGWGPRKFKDNFWVFLSCKGQESLFSDMLEVWNNFSKTEWKKDHSFSKFYVQNRQFQGIKKLGDLTTSQGFWKHLGIVRPKLRTMKSLYIAQLRTRAWQTLKVWLKIEKNNKTLNGELNSWSSDCQTDALVSMHTKITLSMLGRGWFVFIKWFQPHTLHVPFILYYLAWWGPLCYVTYV